MRGITKNRYRTLVFVFTKKILILETLIYRDLTQTEKNQPLIEKKIWCNLF